MPRVHPMTSNPGDRTPTFAALLFFGLVPVLIGLLLGATRAGVALYFPWSTGLVFWIASSLAVWWCLYAGSALTGVVLRPWHPPLWLVLVAGAILGSLVARHLVFGMAVLLEDYMLDGRTPRPLAPFEPSWDFLVHYLQGWAGVYATWLAVGLIFDRFFGLPRYSRPRDATPATAAPATGTAPAPAVNPVQEPASPAAAGPTACSPLLDRLPARIGRNVLALQAEDHYVRVYTDKGSALVLARLSDAIEALGPLDGLQVHRSWWVRRDAVARVAPQGKGLLLTLVSGAEVPVSQAYKALARQAGLSPAVPRGPSAAVGRPLA